MAQCLSRRSQTFAKKQQIGLKFGLSFFQWKGFIDKTTIEEFVMNTKVMFMFVMGLIAVSLVIYATYMKVEVCGLTKIFDHCY